MQTDKVLNEALNIMKIEHDSHKNYTQQGGEWNVADIKCLKWNVGKLSIPKIFSS